LTNSFTRSAVLNLL